MRNKYLLRLKNELLSLNIQFVADHDHVVEGNVILNCGAVLSSMNFNLSTKLELPFIFILKEIIY